jgi:hypothetical protein
MYRATRMLMGGDAAMDDWITQGPGFRRHPHIRPLLRAIEQYQAGSFSVADLQGAIDMHLRAMESTIPYGLRRALADADGKLELAQYGASRQAAEEIVAAFIARVLSLINEIERMPPTSLG